MKSFLLRGKKPFYKWSLIPDNIFFQGDIPEGYSLAICPHHPYIILDVDNHKINGFKHIPSYIQDELNLTLNYDTPNKGKHYWMYYTGKKELSNRATKYGLDLRTHNGYVRWYLDDDIRRYINQINKTTFIMNMWLNELFKK